MQKSAKEEYIQQKNNSEKGSRRYVTFLPKINNSNSYCRSLAIIIILLLAFIAFGQAKPDGQSVASRQQALTATYERLVQAAEVLPRFFYASYKLRMVSTGFIRFGDVSLKTAFVSLLSLESVMK